MISPIVPGFSRLEIEELRGVNRRGDAVGQVLLITENPDLEPVHRAAYLRAVPVACVGDLNHDGDVSAPDLAVLLGAWCSEGGANCDALADLNTDGAVDAPDLALLLGNWGTTPCGGECAPDAMLVPPELSEESKDAVDFAIVCVGLTDIEGYRAWAASAPAELRELVERIIWQVAKGGAQ